MYRYDNIHDQYSDYIEEGMSLRDYVLIIWNHKKIIALIFILFAVGSVIKALITPPQYVSSSKLITKSGENGISSQLSGLASIAGINLKSKKSKDLSSYLPEIIQDYDFMKKVLAHRWEYNGDSVYLNTIWKLEVDTTRENWRYVSEKKQVDKLRNGGYVRITEDESNGLLTLKTSFGDPKLAYQLNDYVLTLIDEYIKESYKSQAKENRSFIEQRIEEVKRELDRAEYRLADFREKNTMSTAPKIILEDQRLQRKVDINQQIYIQLKNQYEIARIEEKKDIPLIEIIKKPEIPLIKSSPKRREMVITGSTLGLFVGILFVFMLNRYKSNFKHE
jgi:uncharacterized protein involved in exopolysaccharide biosynthesis